MRPIVARQALVGLGLALGLFLTLAPAPSRAVDCSGLDPQIAAQLRAQGKCDATSGDSSNNAAISTGDNFPKINQVSKDKSLFDVSVTVVNFLLALAGALAIIFLIFGGIRYIISSGSPDAIDRAKKTVTYAVIGIIVVLLSYAIVKILATAGGG